ncbi:MAG TPA: hypothetical protein VF286_14230 [Acidiphilium sp.]
MRIFLRRIVIVLTGLCTLGCAGLAVMTMLAAAMMNPGMFHDEEMQDFHRLVMATLVFGVLFVAEIVLWGFTGNRSARRG